MENVIVHENVISEFGAEDEEAHPGAVPSDGDYDNDDDDDDDNEPYWTPKMQRVAKWRMGFPKAFTKRFKILRF